MEFESGMQRDTTEGKINYLLVRDGPMFRRFAIHLTKGAEKYDPRNWMKAEGESELERFRESAARHFEQWLAGDRDEDHAAAVIFNINGAEYVREKLEAKPSEQILTEDQLEEEFKSLVVTMADEYGLDLEDVARLAGATIPRKPQTCKIEFLEHLPMCEECKDAGNCLGEGQVDLY